MKSIRHMRPYSLVLVVALAAIAAACTTPPGGGGGPATPVTVYDSNPSPLPAAVSSQGFQCCQTSEFGDQIEFAGSARKLQTATVTMANWAIHSTPANQSFGDASGWDQDLTLNLYAVGPDDSYGNPTVGAAAVTVTQTFHIPWRPEPEPANCSANPTKWQSVDGPDNTNCWNSLATQVTFDLSGMNFIAPNQVVWGVAFNTQSYGDTPTGVDGPYNSLNVGAQGTGASVGTDVDSSVAWIKTAFNGFMCDNGSGGTNVFRPDAGCAPGSDWTGYTPEISFTAV